MLPFLPLYKADQERRLVYARAAAEEPDKTREIMDYVTAVPQFQLWSKQYSDATMGKSLGNIRAMHNPRHLAGKVEKIEYDDKAKAVDVCIKVLDPVDWLKVEAGGYTGLSIGGGYLKKWTDAAGLTRYTPRIQEISLVDSPCIPSARIMELQKSDGSSEEVLLKGEPRSFVDLLPPRTFGDLQKFIIPAVLGTVGGLMGAKAGARTGVYTGYRSLARRAARGEDVAGDIITAHTVGRHIGRGALIGAGLEGGGGIALGRHWERRRRAARKQEILGNLEKLGPIAGGLGVAGLIAGTAGAIAAARRVGGRIARRMAEGNEARMQNSAIHNIPPGSLLRQGDRIHRRLGDRLTGKQKQQLARGVLGAAATGYFGGYGAGVYAGHRIERKIKRKRAERRARRATLKQEILGNLEKASVGAIARGAVGMLSRGVRGVHRVASAGGRLGERAGNRYGGHVGRVLGYAATGGAIGTGVGAGISAVDRRRRARQAMVEEPYTKQDINEGLAKADLVDAFAPQAFTKWRNKQLQDRRPPRMAAPVQALETKARSAIGLGKAASPEEREKIRATLHEFKHGKLRSYRGVNPASGKPRKGPKVTDRKQAVAIALSQARRMGKSDPAFIASLADSRQKRALEDGALRKDAGDVPGPTNESRAWSGDKAFQSSSAFTWLGSKPTGPQVSSVMTMAEPTGNLAKAVRSTPGPHPFNTGTPPPAVVAATLHGAAGHAGQLSEKQHAERIAAAKARWHKEGHHDLDAYHSAQMAIAQKSMLGRSRKIAAAQAVHDSTWHAVADAQAGYDKLRPHLEKDANLMMTVGHGGMLHNPEGVGESHFDASGTHPKKPLYIMHPDEVDDWIAKYGKKTKRAA